MAETFTPRAGSAQDVRSVPEPEPQGAGWVLFAGIMLLVVGIMNTIYGIAAIDGSQFYAAGTNYLLTDLNTWGWILLSAGVIQMVAAFGVWSGSEIGRWVGMLSAGVNAIVQLTFISAFPLASVSLLAIDILVIYGLAAYGGHKFRQAL